MPQSFAKVALTPKWLGALVLALLAAALFAALGQWQLSRAITNVGHKPTTAATVPLQKLTKPGEIFKDSYIGRKVSIEPQYVQLLGRVANRTQDGKTGYWQVGLAQLADGTKVVIAYDFQTSKNVFPSGSDVPDGRLTGFYLPSEEPQPSSGQSLGAIYQSLSVEQLINSTIKPAGPVYSGFVAIQDLPIKANTIKITTTPQSTEVNALNAFYAIEWTLFAGFAVFLWWRLVQDERLGVRAER